MIEQVQKHVGAVGLAATGGFNMVGWLVEMTPVWQALSLLASLIAGVLTIAWYVSKFYRKLFPKR